MTELYDRILGSLYTAAMGDALGARGIQAAQDSII